MPSLLLDKIGYSFGFRTFLATDMACPSALLSVTLANSFATPVPTSTILAARLSGAVTPAFSLWASQEKVVKRILQIKIAQAVFRLSFNLL
jgi:hypothetical protein